MLPFFKDSRYIRINGKPVFGIHRSDSVENIDDLIDTWQEMAAKEGFQIYFLDLNQLQK